MKKQSLGVKRRRWMGLAMGGLMVLSLGCGPIGPFAGGALRGVVETEAVIDPAWGEGVERAQLETRPSDPHSVNTWFLIDQGTLFVPTSMILGPKEPTDRSWVTHVAEDPRVRIRIGERVFERRATKLPAGAEAERIRSALEARYALDVADRDPERIIWIYRLDPR